ncbi:MAG: T9SS type A sorting domain-containing protein [Bacteroidia bacterium]|nr:T9SS type A sorting domain-containing protein [Bacteroidia bacterium]
MRFYPLLIIFLGLFWGQLFAQQPYTETLTEVWNDNTSTWDSSSRVFVTYNTNQRAETYRAESYQNATWLKLALTNYTYVNGTDIDQITQYNWNLLQGVYHPVTLTAYSYVSGKVSTIVSSAWNSLSQQFIPSSRTVYTYNAGLVQVEQSERYDTTTQTYTPLSRYTCTYTPTNKIQIRLQENYNAGQWQNSARITYSYDPNDNITYILTETYQQGSGQWANSYSQSYSYNMYQELNQILTSIWNGSSWQQQNRLIYTYNQDGTMHNYTTYVWQQNNFVNSQRTTFFYQPLTSLASVPNKPNIRLYPNPSQDYFGIQGVSQGMVSLKTLTGQVVFQTYFSENQQFSISDIPAGIYIAEVSNAEKGAPVANLKITICH